MTAPLVLTKVVRNVLKAKLRQYSPLYTNRYEKCRTVKAYSADRDGSIRAALDEALKAAGSTDHTIKVYEHTGFFGRSNSLIVRIPN